MGSAAAKRAPRGPRKGIAEELAKKQREISVSEFFARNKQILGYDSATKALITVVKEGVDNSLDACEEADILPDLTVQIKKRTETEYTIIIEDNGPGIIKKQLPRVFARLLYGSRFHGLSQSRGAQGLGISGAVMYGQITTGRPSIIRSKTAKEDVAYQIHLRIDTRRNKGDLVKEEFVPVDIRSGTRLELTAKGRYVAGKQSVVEYLRRTAIVNPHARIVFKPPDGRPVTFERVTEELPPKTREVKPHPYGVELGTLLAMAKDTETLRMTSFLQQEFSRISSRVAKEICDTAMVPGGLRPKKLTLDQAKAILDAIEKVRIMAPESEGLSPIGERLVKRGLKNVLGNLRPEFFAPPLTRNPAVYSGTPFQVEVGIVYGGDLVPDQPVEILRYANRVPLLYAGGACAATQAISSVDWRRYGLEQRGGKGVPYGPAIILVHVASIRVPFTSEAKEAIAPIPEVLTEIQLALKECGRRLKTHLNKKAKKAKTREKFEIVQKILPQIAEKSAAVVGKKVPNLDATITKIMGIVWIEEKVEWKGDCHKVTVDVHNFTSAGKRLHLHTLLPKGAGMRKPNPKPYEKKVDGKISWDLKRVPSVKRATVTFEVTKLDKGEYDESELFVSRIGPELVIGAGPLPGDWELDYTEFEEEEAEELEEEADAEVDYDEAEEELPDE
jgi:DNA topoisomerase-6 subunit B